MSTKIKDYIKTKNNKHFVWNGIEVFIKDNFINKEISLKQNLIELNSNSTSKIKKAGISNNRGTAIKTDQKLKIVKLPKASVKIIIKK